MKKLKLLSIAAAGMLFAACSSNEVVDNGNGGEKDGKGFISVTINLPTTPSTRAVNDDYDDGLTEEYNVKDAILLLFHGESEAAATFYHASALSLPKVSDEDNDNITTSYLSVAEVNDTYTTNLWALVLVNSNGLFDLGTMTVATGVADGYKLTDATKIADLQGVITNNEFKSEKGFFMTNAVLSNAAGGTATLAPAKGNLSVLAKLADNCIKDTEAEAKNNPAGSIFVERAVAKATLSVAENAGKDLGITSVLWALNNTEPTSYFVRNMGDADYIGYSSEAFSPSNYRFAGHVKLGTTPIQPEVDFYRTYWCIDPQYSDNAANLTKAYTYGGVGLENPQYCHENTFDVSHQTYRNTTRAVIKVTTDGSDFYTVNGLDQKETKETAESKLQEVFIKDAGLENAIKDNLKSDAGTVTINTSSFSWAWNTVAASGKYEMDGNSITLSEDLKGKLKADADNNAIAAAIKAAAETANQYVDVLKYTRGEMYYEARFMHFASNDAPADLAPWNTWETTKPSVGGVANAYPGNAAQNYLGRYGMVRNNWYDVKITAFNHIGSPVEPSITIEPDGGGDTPDDNVNSKYISVKINVLSWAKRTQGWSF